MTGAQTFVKDVFRHALSYFFSSKDVRRDELGDVLTHMLLHSIRDVFRRIVKHVDEALASEKKVLSEVFGHAFRHALRHVFRHVDETRVSTSGMVLCTAPSYDRWPGYSHPTCRWAVWRLSTAGRVAFRSSRIVHTVNRK